MLVTTRKTVFQTKKNAACDWRQRLGRGLLQGIVASLLLSHAPAYAAPSPSAERKGQISPHRKCGLGLGMCLSRQSEQLESKRRKSRLASRHSGRQQVLGSNDEPNILDAASPINSDVPHGGDVISVGLASWYSADRYNKQTSSGVRFDENAMTAAHPWLPMGTRVRVTLQGSNTSVIVTINDRQGSKSRVIDLSKRAAKELGILDRGIAHVILTRS